MAQSWKNDGGISIDTAEVNMKNTGFPIYTPESGNSNHDVCWIAVATIGHSFIAALSFAIYTLVNATYVLPKYHFAVVSLWNGMFGLLLYFTTANIMVTSLPFNVLPLCFFVLIANGVLASGVIICSNIALVHVPPSEFAILAILSIAFIFIAHPTFMGGYQAPYGELFEYIGGGLIVVALLLEPVGRLIERFFIRKKTIENKEIVI